MSSSSQTNDCDWIEGVPFISLGDGNQHTKRLQPRGRIGTDRGIANTSHFEENFKLSTPPYPMVCALESGTDGRELDPGRKK